MYIVVEVDQCFFYLLLMEKIVYVVSDIVFGDCFEIQFYFWLLQKYVVGCFIKDYFLWVGQCQLGFDISCVRYVVFVKINLLQFYQWVDGEVKGVVVYYVGCFGVLDQLKDWLVNGDWMMFGGMVDIYYL